MHTSRTTRPDASEYAAYQYDNRGRLQKTTAPTGTIQVSRQNLARGYSESFTLAVTPSADGAGNPTGAETFTLADIKTLTRTHTNKSGQVIYVDRYFNLGGLTNYAADAILPGAVEGTHYSRTYQDYNARGRAHRSKSATGTITRTVFDALGRAASTWIGTNDTGATDADPTGGGASGNNMTKVSEQLYDATEEVQFVQLTGTPTGTFTLSFSGSSPSTPIAHNASALTVQQALEPLSTVGVSNVSVAAVTGGWHVRFRNALGGLDVATLVADGSQLSGGAVQVTTVTAGGLPGVGDGNLTQTTLFPGGTAANRATRHYYDWRNRRVATKAAAENPAGGESTTLNRPVSYTEYDNLSQAVAQESHDGDQVTFPDAVPADGVPDKPAQASRRALAESLYDEQGRVYRTLTWSVDQSSGAKSATALKSDVWYNKRGQTLKMLQPGGLVMKSTYELPDKTIGFVPDKDDTGSQLHPAAIALDRTIKSAGDPSKLGQQRLTALHRTPNPTHPRLPRLAAFRCLQAEALRGSPLLAGAVAVGTVGPRGR